MILGEHNLETDPDVHDRVEQPRRQLIPFSFSDVITHEDFDKGCENNKCNDIALIRLQKPAHISLGNIFKFSF